MRIGVIGAGKVGIALGRALQERGFVISCVASRREASLETARGYIGEDAVYTTRNERVPELADVIAVTTQDREIAGVARQLSRIGGALQGKTVFHTSGAHPFSELTPLEEVGAYLGSLHPLQTFPDIDSGIAVLPDTYIFIEGSPKALPTLRTLASAIGAETVAIDSGNKVLYHLAAVFLCNLLTALMFSGEGITRRIGIDLQPFYPIIRATLKNIETKGPLASLTGPVVRGDVGTIESHLGALKGMELHEEVYRSLSRVALRMAEERRTLDDGQRTSLEHLLEERTSLH
jgi:predicted short-subunit dehydrogenase-like oxidoreductase (DUF2520 family)